MPEHTIIPGILLGDLAVALDLAADGAEVPGLDIPCVLRIELVWLEMVRGLHSV